MNTFILTYMSNNELIRFFEAENEDQAIKECLEESKKRNAGLKLHFTDKRMQLIIGYSKFSKNPAFNCFIFFKIKIK